MKINSLIKNTFLRTSLLLIAGFILGWLVFHKTETVQKPATEITETKKTVWTCSMHPQIRKDAPGQCPICGMDLIPLVQDAAPTDPNAISMTEDAARIAEVQTSVVGSRKTEKEIRLYGKIKADERLVQTMTAHVEGRIEQLLINFTGEMVHKGQTIARIYSPALITSQQELFEALKMGDTSIISAAREKLRQWKLSNAQIAGIEKSGQVKTVFDVQADISGIVTAKKVNNGDYVRQGSPLYEIADLSHVWALFDAYESDLPWIRSGDRVSFTLQSMPGKAFEGTVSFIDPVIDPLSRVALLRVEVANGSNLIKPEMFATGILKSRIGPAGGGSIVIPHSAVLWTGPRSIVYVRVKDASQPTFLMRQITLGPDLGDSYVVESGLTEGEEIVTNGTFNIDASAQLQGKQSMMNEKTDSIPKQTDIQRIESGPELKAQVMGLFTAYDDLKNSLVDSDTGKASAASRHLSENLGKVDSGLIGAGQIDAWTGFARTIGAESLKIVNSTDLELQRTSFAAISGALYKILKAYGTSETVYYQYCPMAFNNKGAYWLSETNKILNPFFGKTMLTCGETREVIKN